MQNQELLNTQQIELPPYPKPCMLDIETLDTTPTAKILSLGAVAVYGNETWYQEFATYLQTGRTASQAALEWWESKSVKPNGNKTLTDGLHEFSEWYKDQQFTEVWCKGSDFDFVILADAYKSMGVETPWKYNEVRDLRTLIKVFPHIKSPAPYSNHHALVDAICQAQHLKELVSYVSQFNLAATAGRNLIQGAYGTAPPNSIR
jgi:hypothetical protein